MSARANSSDPSVSTEKTMPSPARKPVVANTGPPTVVRTHASRVRSAVPNCGAGISTIWSVPSRDSARPVTTRTGGTSRTRCQTWAWD